MLRRRCSSARRSLSSPASRLDFDAEEAWLSLNIRRSRCRPSRSTSELRGVRSATRSRGSSASSPPRSWAASAHSSLAGSGANTAQLARRPQRRATRPAEMFSDSHASSASKSKRLAGLDKDTPSTGTTPPQHGSRVRPRLYREQAHRRCVAGSRGVPGGEAAPNSRRGEQHGHDQAARRHRRRGLGPAPCSPSSATRTPSGRPPWRRRAPDGTRSPPARRAASSTVVRLQTRREEACAPSARVRSGRDQTRRGGARRGRPTGPAAGAGPRPGGRGSGWAPQGHCTKPRRAPGPRVDGGGERKQLRELVRDLGVEPSQASGLAHRRRPEAPLLEIRRRVGGGGA